MTLALIVGVGINHVYWAVTDWHLKDMGAYWDAAIRLRDAQPLFPAGVDIEASNVYRYSPWFAWMWIPLTYLPRAVANVGWSAVLLAASVAAVLPIIRLRAWHAVAFFFPVLVGISATGNVHPLLIAALVLGVERRTAPLWIALAASLKFFPLLLVVTYIGRREWQRAAATFAIAGLLLAPFLLYDLSNYVTSAGGAALLWSWPAAYAVVVVVLAGFSLVLAAGRYGWLASAVTVTLALPRFFLYDVTYLMVGANARPRSRLAKR